jgi:hypothetical protein
MNPDVERSVEADRNAEGPPPFGRSWTRLYAAVLIWLALLIVLFYLFSRRFAP